MSDVLRKVSEIEARSRVPAVFALTQREDVAWLIATVRAHEAELVARRARVRYEPVEDSYSPGRIGDG